VGQRKKSIGRQEGLSGDTIFALASAPGRAGIAIVRVSGPNAALALAKIAGLSDPEPRRAIVRPLMGADGDIIDDALMLWFAKPASFTGEDVAEFHVHGGRAIIEALLTALAALPGLRPAEPGEFTRRAVENGKLDLTRAEAVADLVDAETPAQRRQAMRQYEGGLAALYDGWREKLIKASAWAEAAIDFSEEEIPQNVIARAKAQAAEIHAEIREHLDDSHRGEIVREGVRFAIIGPPNAGKSSLLNALARRDVAIVSETPGTTRDVIEVKLDIGGYPVIAADTAGLREATDAIEMEGVRRAFASADQADLVLLLLDGSQPADGKWPEHDLVALNKCDLRWPLEQPGLRISVQTGEGMDALLTELACLVREMLEQPTEAAPITRLRHRYALQIAEASLSRALLAPEPELVAEDMRLAMRALGRITGRVDIEDLLDVIFRDFCIGK
jgi:tRNA modification GTPase